QEPSAKQASHARCRNPTSVESSAPRSSGVAAGLALGGSHAGGPASCASSAGRVSLPLSRRRSAGHRPGTRMLEKSWLAAAPGSAAAVDRISVDCCPGLTRTPGRLRRMPLLFWRALAAVDSEMSRPAATNAPSGMSVRDGLACGTRAGSAVRELAVLAGTPLETALAAEVPDTPMVPLLVRASGSSRLPGSRAVSITPLSLCSKPSACPTSWVRTLDRAICPPATHQPHPPAPPPLHLS